MAAHFLEDPLEAIIEKASEHGLPVTHDDMEYIEHRVYHDWVGGTEFDVKIPHLEPDAITNKKSWNPYEQDMSRYPEIFKKYTDNYDRYEQVKKKFATETPF